MKAISRFRVGTSCWAAWAALATFSLAMAGCHSQHKAEGPQAFVPIAPGSFAQIWSVNLGLGKAKAEHIYPFDNLLIVYADDNTAHVVDRATGRLMFINDLPRNSGTLYPPSVVGDRIIYPATSSIKIYSAKGGQLMSNFNVPYALKTTGSGSGNNFYISADFPNGGRVVSIDLTNPTPSRWELMTVAATRSMPVLYKGVVFIASEDGKVRAVTEDKQGVWSLNDNYDGSFQAGGKIFGNIAVDDSAVYIACTDTKLYALNRNSGKIKWQYYAGTSLQDAPIVTADMLYVYVPEQGLAALTKLEGDYNRRPKWVDPAALQFVSEDEKNTYILRGNGHLAALDKMSGVQQFESKSDEFTQVATNSKDALIYAIDEGTLICIKPVLKQGVMGELVQAPLELRTQLASR